MKKLILQLLGALLIQGIVAQSQTLTTMATFNDTNGAYPMSLVQGSDGNFYGTTKEGNLSFNQGYGYGTVFRMTPNGVLTTLFNFNSTNGIDPIATLVQGSDYNFYGTTVYGGTNDISNDGLGTVFQITTNGTLTTLVNFNSTNGANPFAALVQSDGAFFGTTLGGGAYNAGTVFKMTTNGTLTTLVSFNDTNGAYTGPITKGSDGNFYGVNNIGGTSDSGTVFKMTPNGMLTTLTNFNDANGDAPEAALIQGNDGNFYGTTTGGGKYSDGTLFKITTNGALTTLVHFDGTNGLYPQASLLQASDGNFYGTTREGGNVSLNHGSGYGTIFKITPNGTLTTLINFDSTNGTGSGRLLQGNDGSLYGTAGAGGPSGYGTIFKITGLNLLPSIQSVCLTNGIVQLAFNSVSNWTYRVQYKTNLTDATWTDLPGDVLATNAMAFKTDPLISGQRFYRLILLR